jgi:hypothetical protein
VKNMKNLIVLLLTLMPLTSFADNGLGFIKLQGLIRDQVQDNKNDATKYGVKATVGHAIDSEGKVIVDFDYQILGATKGSNTQNASRVETGITTTNGAFFIRGGIGEKFTPTDNLAYWSVTPGYKHKINDQYAVGIAWRYRTAFDKESHDTSNTLQLVGEYSFDKANILSVQLAASRGDTDQNGLNIGYTHKF